jgi:hypothetical protein
VWVRPLFLLALFPRPKRPTLTLRQKAERLRLLACLPDSPVYGSDLVPLIDDVTTALLGLLPPEAQP